MKIWNRLWHKQDPNEYKIKDNHLVRSLRVRDLLGLGIGMIVSASIFTLPGEVAAMHTGPAVVISFVLAGLAAGLIALIYAEPYPFPVEVESVVESSLLSPSSWLSESFSKS